MEFWLYKVLKLKLSKDLSFETPTSHFLLTFRVSSCSSWLIKQ